MVLAQRQKYRSMEQNRKPRDKSIKFFKKKSFEKSIYEIFSSPFILKNKSEENTSNGTKQMIRATNLKTSYRVIRTFISKTLKS